jgi:cyclopropane-fatty-acyl-phospholipid synthase
MTSTEVPTPLQLVPFDAEVTDLLDSAPADATRDNGGDHTDRPVAPVLSLAQAPSADSDRLLRRTQARSFGTLRLAGRARAAGAARSLLANLGRRMTVGYLQVRDVDGTIHGFGDAAAPDDLRVDITVNDQRAWLATASEGSIGFGRGYIEGWWHTDDPTGVVRILVKNLGPLDQFRNRMNRYTGPVGDTVRRALPRNSRKRNREDIGAHYDLSNDFFSLFLDPTMTYSAGVFRVDDEGLPADDDATLALASLAKYDRLLEKLQVTDEHRLLEIGTGWGGLALRAAETRGASVTSTTVSSRQLEEAEHRTAASTAGERIELLSSDWRDLTGTYDRLISIEMIEAVDWRDYDRFFATIERCLAPDGMVGLQAICVPDQRYHRTKNTEDFIRRFVFPGGFLPSIGSITDSVARATQLQILDVEDFSAHYAETLRRWRLRFDQRLDEVAALGLDERFQRLWRFYLAYCEAAFVERHCTVNQFVLAGPDWRPNGLELITR